MFFNDTQDSQKRLLCPLVCRFAHSLAQPFLQPRRYKQVADKLMQPFMIRPEDSKNHFPV